MAHRDEFTKPILPGKGATDYERYLRTDELLALQKPPEELLHKDEMTFLVVHQRSELLMKGAAFRTRPCPRIARALRLRQHRTPDSPRHFAARAAHRPAAHSGDHHSL